ncbi:MAG TPA: alpha/beta fold hydrolase [Gemmatimonadaceae bacterium]|nr:alpha/beta fold hydrolase [Gemmatimonadaceae bacterium]
MPPDDRTIARTLEWLGASPAALPRWIFPVAPDLAARLVIHRFATPRRLPRRGPPLPHPSTLDIDGARVAVYTQGQGTPVLLVHGWEGSAHDMATLAGALAAAGFRAVAIDLPAHGRSAGRRLTLPDAGRVVRRAAERIGPLAAVVGHSLGAAAVLLALRDGLRARCGVALAPPRRVEPFLEQFARSLGVGRRHDAALRRALEARVGPLDDLDADRVARAIRRPGLVVHDRGDRVIPLSDASAVAHAWPGARLVATEGLGHRRILHDETVARHVARFVLHSTSGAATPRGAFR